MLPSRIHRAIHFVQSHAVSTLFLKNNLGPDSNYPLQLSARNL